MLDYLDLDVGISHCWFHIIQSSNVHAIPNTDTPPVPPPPPSPPPLRLPNKMLPIRRLVDQGGYVGRSSPESLALYGGASLAAVASNTAAAMAMAAGEAVSERRSESGRSASGKKAGEAKASVAQYHGSRPYLTRYEHVSTASF